jgi:hypothetical protein
MWYNTAKYIINIGNYINRNFGRNEMRKINDDKIEKYVNELGEEYKVLLLEALLGKSDSLFQT